MKLMKGERRFNMEIQIDVPDGKSGNWEVSTFTVSEKDVALGNIRAMFKPGGRTINPGTYKRLTRNGNVIMSNTQAEISDQLSFIYIARRAGGHVLINGLGLGVTLSAILESEEIESITVIEKSEDVINLVASTFTNDKRVSIIHADAYEWRPPKDIRYSAVWHDIWDDICTDNLPQMTKLHRKYGKRCDWQESWCRELCQRYARY